MGTEFVLIVAAVIVSISTAIFGVLDVVRSIKSNLRKK